MRGLAELRRSLAALREDGEGSGRRPPLPGIDGIARLVEAARRDGLDVHYAPAGHPGVDAAAGLALYRIAQEALANAARHAPRARTTVTISPGAAAIRLDVVNEIDNLTCRVGICIDEHLRTNPLARRPGASGRTVTGSTTTST